MKQDGRGRVIDLMGVHEQIPRNAANDPAFEDLAQLQSVFTDEEIVTMVNRFLYSAEYQRNTHRHKERERAAKTAALRAKVRELFGTSWLRATEEQLRVAAAECERDREV